MGDSTPKETSDAVDKFLERSSGSSRNLTKGIHAASPEQEMEPAPLHCYLSYTELKKETDNHVTLYIKGAFARLEKERCILDKVKHTVLIPRDYAESLGIVE